MIKKTDVPAKINPNWFFKEIDGKLQGLIFNVISNGLNQEIKEVKLNATSALILEKIDGVLTVKEIEIYYKGLFKDDIDQKIIENDVCSVLEHLIKINAIILNLDTHKFYEVIGKYYFI